MTQKIPLYDILRTSSFAHTHYFLNEYIILWCDRSRVPEETLGPSVLRFQEKVQVGVNPDRKTRSVEWKRSKDDTSELCRYKKKWEKVLL